MRRFSITLLTAVALAIAPTAASAQSSVPAPEPILTKLGKTPMVELWDGGGGLPYLGATESYNAGDWENALRKYHDSGVYEAQIAKVDAVASHWLSRAGRRGAARRFKLQRRGGHKRGVKIVRTSRRGKHGRPGHDKRKPAIVFDVDETALSNYTAIDADNFTFGTNSQAEAVNEIGEAINPSLALYKLAQQRGIATFFITGRRENVRDHTASNLNREGFTDYTELVLKPNDFTGSTVAYKSGARAAIEATGYRIVANVGDQYSDLAGGHEAVAFKLPNPFYFLP
jgi:putative acid phosphatase of HAD superfamily subfamily IIIB